MSEETSVLPPRTPRGSAVAVTLGLTLLYGLSATWSVQALDSGELAAAVERWGVPHPPGFATYMIVAGALARLSPLGTTADLSLFSVLAGSATAGLLVWLMLDLGLARRAAVVAALAWALLPQTWQLHGLQEVLGPAHLAAALVLVAARAAQRARGLGGWLLLGCACSAGAGLHSAVVLTGPVVLAVLLAPATLPRRSPLRWSGFAAGLLLGLLPQAYLPLATRWGGLPRWGNVASVGALLRHLARTDYGAFDLALGVKASPLGVVQRYLLHGLSDGALLYGPLLLLGAGLCLACLLRTARGATCPRPQPAADGPSTAYWAGLLGAWLVGVLVFLPLFRTPDTAWWREVSARFFPLVGLLGLPLLGWGLDWGLARLPLAPRARRAALVAWLAVLALLAAPEGVQRGRNLVEGYGDDLLDFLPPGALLVGQSDLAANAVWEAQAVRGRRPDVVFVAEPLLPAPWYAAQARAGLDGYLHPPGQAGLRLLLRHALERGRAVYVTDGLAEALRSSYQLVPEGVALRVLPSGVPAPPPAALAEQGALLPVTERLAGRLLPPWLRYDAVSRALLERYERPWASLDRAFSASGDVAAAAHCRAVLAWLRPWEDRSPEHHPAGVAP